jgi:hypothetical protein
MCASSERRGRLGGCDTQHGAMRAARRALRRLTCPRHGSRPRDIAKEAAAAAAAACARTGIRPRPNTAHGARRTGCRHSPHTARPRGPASAAARLVCAPARPSVSVGTHLMLPATWAGLCAHAGCRLRGTARASARPRRRMQRQNSACMSARARVHTRARGSRTARVRACRCDARGGAASGDARHDAGGPSRIVRRATGVRPPGPARVAPALSKILPARSALSCCTRGASTTQPRRQPDFAPTNSTRVRGSDASSSCS